MSETLNRAGYSLACPHQHLDLYPFQQRFLIWGLVAALIAGSYLTSPLAGFSFLVLFGAVGALWRRDEPPILAFCIAYQWLFVVTGYFYLRIAGKYPRLQTLGNLESAIFLSLIGFLILVVGIRTGFYFLRLGLVSEQRKLQISTSRYDVRRLFWYVVALYTVNWLVIISPKEILFNAAQIIESLLAFRHVLLVLLFLAIFQQQRGYRYGAVACMYALVPQLMTGRAWFLQLFIFLLIVVLMEWRPWSMTKSDRRRRPGIVWAATGIVMVILVGGLIWSSGVKSAWREALRERGAMVESPIAGGKALGSIVMRVRDRITLSQTIEFAAGRLSSAVLYFGNVLERVPDVLPHEEGALTMRALGHTVKPRFLFPDKPILGSDSLLTRRYTGLSVAGPELWTSIGLGYMAEFYIDFGVLGMFVPIFLLGLIAGLIYGAILLFSPSYNFFSSAVIILFTQHFAGYESEITKLLGGLVMNFLIFAAILYYAGLWLHRKLLVGKEASSIAKV